MTRLRISVVLATLNRIDLLERLLHHLAHQVDPPDFEVIVADNGSNDSTPRLLHNHDSPIRLKSVLVRRRGKGYALNRALAMAEGKFVVFTDDDIIPDSCWLREWDSAFQRSPGVDVFGGRILVDAERVPSWIRRSHNLTRLLAGEHDHGGKERPYAPTEFPFGPNMAVRRERLRSVTSPYPVSIGPGAKLSVGDETAFFCGIGCGPRERRIYAAKAVVRHEVEVDNVRFLGALKRCYQAGTAAGMTSIAMTPGVGDSMVGLKRDFRVIGRRFRQCRSLRELCCISLRYAGYVRGRRFPE